MRPCDRRSACSTSAILGKASITGPGAAEFVNRCLTNDLAKIAPGQAQYTLICNSRGGVVDDLIAYLRSADDVFLIPQRGELCRGGRACSPKRHRRGSWSPTGTEICRLGGAGHAF
jgi:hypothetical protein